MSSSAAMQSQGVSNQVNAPQMIQLAAGNNASSMIAIQLPVFDQATGQTVMQTLQVENKKFYLGDFLIQSILFG